MFDNQTPDAKDSTSFLSRSFGLTRRETDVLRLVSVRYGNPEIAERLGISKRTVESHMAALLRKVDVADRAALIRTVRDAVRAPVRARAQERHRIRLAAARARADAEHQRAISHDALRKLLDTLAKQQAAVEKLSQPNSPT